MCEKLEKCVKSWKVWSGGVVPGLNIVVCVRKVAIVGFFFHYSALLELTERF